MKTIRGTDGFSAINVVVAVVIVGAISLACWYIWNSNRDTSETSFGTTKSQVATNSGKSADTTSPDKSEYLSVPEEGIKFELSPEIEDAYYFKDNQGYIYLSVRGLDNMEGAESCAAKGNAEGQGSGLVSLVVAEVGAPNSMSADNQDWTQQQLDKSSFKKIDNKYYGFSKGNGACFDMSNRQQSDYANSVIQAFVKQQVTITEL